MIDRKYVDALPDLGKGGKTIGDYLIYAAEQVKSHEKIVELGPWLGSATGYLALGARKYGAKIYSFDRWQADEDYQRKAYEHNGLLFERDQDVLPAYLENMIPFAGTVVPTKCDVMELKWQCGKIGLLVDDIATGKSRFDHVMETLLPYFLPKKTIIVLMDYYFYQKKKSRILEYQKDFMEANTQSFRFLFGIKSSMAAVFRYEGKADRIKYVPGESHKTKNAEGEECK